MNLDKLSIHGFKSIRDLSTQSPTLVNHFAPEDIIVINREEGASTFRRLSSNELENWLEDYALGELWVKDVIVGGPRHE
ncbi:MAG: hypothetical protein HC877_14995 [Thioploca sp.]|nr:hypothetical protein [Thioploca sp.]